MRTLEIRPLGLWDPAGGEYNSEPSNYVETSSGRSSADALGWDPAGGEYNSTPTNYVELSPSRSPGGNSTPVGERFPPVPPQTPQGSGGFFDFLSKALPGPNTGIPQFVQSPAAKTDVTTIALVAGAVVLGLGALLILAPSRAAPVAGLSRRRRRRRR